jgi:hypothetical protein
VATASRVAVGLNGQGKNGSRDGSREALRQPRAGTGVVHGCLSMSCARRCINTRAACTERAPCAPPSQAQRYSITRAGANVCDLPATCLRRACDLPCVCYNCVRISPRLPEWLQCLLHVPRKERLMLGCEEGRRATRLASSKAARAKTATARPSY